MDNENPVMTIRVDIDTWEGANNGISAVIRALEKHSDIKASFLLTTGPDQTGRNIRRIFKTRDFSRLKLKALKRFSLKNLANSIILERKSLDKTHIDILQEARQEGHEFGLHGFHHYLWVSYFQSLDVFQQNLLLQKGIRHFQHILREKPKVFASPGFIWTKNLLRDLDRQGFHCSSDFRLLKGTHAPFFVKFGNYTCSHLQIPVNYPLPYELLLQGASEQAIVRQIIKRTRELLKNSNFGGVFYVHAAVEPLHCFCLFDAILSALEGVGVRFLTLSQIAKEFSNLAPTISLAI
ncbi:MAG: DUF2334 domain-containing protein [Candidatus Hodarchaeota archaeon]